MEGRTMGKNEGAKETKKGEKKGKKRDKQSRCLRVSRRHGRRKRGRRERKAQGYMRREKPADSKMKERLESRWETRENCKKRGRM